MTPDKPAEAREREAFEKWCDSVGLSLRTFSDGGDSGHTTSAWLAWKARASLATEAAQAQEDGPCGGGWRCQHPAKCARGRRGEVCEDVRALRAHVMAAEEMLACTRAVASASQRDSTVYVCPVKDIVCGHRPANWCSECPLRQALEAK
jgi:hypothetical protein